MISTRFCPVCGAANNETQEHCFACGQVLSASDQAGTAAQGELLHERYRLGATIGSGGYSAVYRGWDTQESGRAVAIKQITLQGLDTEETIEATSTYNREIEALSTLSHPQVPHLYDHFNDPDHWYLVLEYIEGQTLESYLEARKAQNKPFQIEEVLGIGLQLCVVLRYLHSRHPPLIFRDLKPDNIMRAPSGKLYLIDFGIARRYTPGQSRDTQSLGSPGYAAPEQYGRAQTDVRTDLYGLGALLHQLLSGQDPSDTPRALPPLRLNGQPGNVELETLVNHLLASDPQDRPASAHDVARELERIRQKRVNSVDSKRIWQPPVPQNYSVASSSSVQQQFQHMQQKAALPKRKRLTRRRVIAGLGVSAVLLGGGAYAYSRLSGQARTAAQAATLTIYNGHTDTVNTLAWSPDGQRIASASADGSVQIWDALTGNLFREDNNRRVSVNTVIWASDGSALYFTEDYKLWMLSAPDLTSASIIWEYTSQVDALALSSDVAVPYFALGFSDSVVAVQSVAGKPPIELRYQGGDITSVAFSPDGWYLASGASDKSVVIWNVKAEERTYAIYQGHTDAVTSVVWLPNGVYLASASADQTVHVWSAVSGTRIFTYQGHTAAVNAVTPSPDGQYLASASSDGTVKVWNAYDGSFLMTYNGHTAPVTSVSWSPDGKFIASASADKTVQVWSTATLSSS